LRNLHDLPHLQAVGIEHPADVVPEVHPRTLRA
jgi:hypothetical protein